MVVALVDAGRDGEEALPRACNRIRLQPANERMDPMWWTPGRSRCRAVVGVTVEVPRGEGIH
jgi:hypothetical protein